MIFDEEHFGSDAPNAPFGGRRFYPPAGQTRGFLLADGFLDFQTSLLDFYSGKM